MNRYMGIDPGDRWIGWCSLKTDKHYIYEARMGVIDRAPFSFTALIEHVIPHAPQTIVCESFQARPVGHNSFSSMETPTLMGALKYLALKRDHMWTEAAAGNPSDLDKMPISPVIKHWMHSVQRDVNWQHAMSAWRVLCKWMMTMHNQDLLRLLKKDVHYTVMGVEPSKDKFEIIAPTLRWEVR